MSERPPLQKQPEAPARGRAESVAAPIGGGHDDDRRWAQERIRNHFAANQQVQRKAKGAAGRAEIPAAGTPLPGDVRAPMEQKLGADLSGVKIGCGGESARAADSLGARAFTVGSDVHFAAGQYAPGSRGGDELLAHELTHVVQGQRSGIQRKPAAAEGAASGGGEHEVSEPGEPAEVEADQVASHVAGELHGDGDGAKADGVKTDGAKADGAKKDGPQAAAPPIAAKLDGVGLKVFRGKGDKAGGKGKAEEPAKKRGDHLFNNGLPKTLREINALFAAMAKGHAAEGILGPALTAAAAAVSIDAFEVTVDKGSGPAGGDDNSKSFGNAKAALMTAVRAYSTAIEGVATADEHGADYAKEVLTTATATLTAAWQAFVDNAYDATCEPLLSKPQKAQAAAGKAALASIRASVGAAFTAATRAVEATAAKPAAAAADGAGKAAAADGGKKKS